MYGPRRHQWGWHRLADHFAEEIVESIGLDSKKLVLDIGAGSGALTKPLAKTGARVIAIELHSKRVAQLRQLFRAHRNVKVVQADASDLWLPRQPFYVVANPPFAITSVLIKRLMHPASQLVQARIVLQKAAASRLMEANWGRGRYVMRISQKLPRSAFVPRPQVDVVVVSITRVPRY